MVLMSDQKDGVAFPGVLDGFVVDLGYQGTGGVDHLGSPAFGELSHLRRDPVGAENDAPSKRNLVELLDKKRTFVPELVHDVSVVNSFLADVNRPSISLQRQVYDVHGPDHAGAEASRRREHNLPMVFFPSHSR